MKNIKTYNNFKLLESLEDSHFELVSGKDIRYWYNRENYCNDKNGILNMSLMSREYAQKFLDIYVENVNNCRLLILLNSNNKLLGRSIIWKAKKMDRIEISEIDPWGEEDWEIGVQENELENIFYMERVYINDPDDFLLFKEYSEKHGWLMSKKEGMRFIDLYGVDNLCVTLKPKDYKYYPYMDTFKYYVPEKGYLYSKKPKNTNSSIYKLDRINGSYLEI